MLVKEVLEKNGHTILNRGTVFPPYPTPTANWSLQESCARPSLFLLLVSETA